MGRCWEMTFTIAGSELLFMNQCFSASSAPVCGRQWELFYEYFVCSYDLFLAFFSGCQDKVKDACLVWFCKCKVQGYFPKARWVWKILSNLSTIFFLETAFISVMCSCLRSLLEASPWAAFLSSWVHRRPCFTEGSGEMSSLHSSQSHGTQRSFPQPAHIAGRQAQHPAVLQGTPRGSAFACSLPSQLLSWMSLFSLFFSLSCLVSCTLEHSFSHAWLCGAPNGRDGRRSVSFVWAKELH